MRFEWNKSKNAINIDKHGIDFEDVVSMFNQPMLTWEDQREDYGESRWIGIGLIKYMIGVVVYVERNESTIRIISARKATKYEVRRYEQSIRN